MCCLRNGFASLKKNQDFRKVYGQGTYAANEMFVAYALANDLSQNRIGITVSKKIGNAVKRNRIKRLVKESCRLYSQLQSSKLGFDFVILARTPVSTIENKGAFVKIDKHIKQLFTRLNKKMSFMI